MQLAPPAIDLHRPQPLRRFPGPSEIRCQDHVEGHPFEPGLQPPQLVAA